MPTPPPWNRSKSAALVYALIALIAIVWMRDTWTTQQQAETPSGTTNASSQSPAAAVG